MRLSRRWRGAKNTQGDGDDSWIKSAVDHMVDREAKAADKEMRKPEFFEPWVIDEVRTTKHT